MWAVQVAPQNGWSRSLVDGFGVVVFLHRPLRLQVRFIGARQFL